MHPSHPPADTSASGPVDSLPEAAPSSEGVGGAPALVVVDTEMTGLLRTRDARPCEVALVVVDASGRELSSWTSLVCVPTPPWADQALRITGITRAEIAAAPSVAEFLADMRAWVRVAAADLPWTSFNLDFDWEMLARLGATDGIRPAEFCVMMDAWRVMDRDPHCQVRRWEDGTLKWPRLSEAAEYFGVAVEQPQHRALGDARTAAAVLRAMWARR